MLVAVSKPRLSLMVEPDYDEFFLFMAPHLFRTALFHVLDQGRGLMLQVKPG